jgi:hypothetical protein
MIKKIYHIIHNMLIWSFLITGFLIPCLVILNKDLSIIVGMTYIHVYFLSVYIAIKILNQNG